MTNSNTTAGQNTGAVGSVGNTVTTPSSGSTGTTPATPLQDKAFRSKLQNLLNGVQAVIANGGVISSVNGTPLSKDSMVQTLTSALAAYGAVDGQKLALVQARQALTAGEAAQRAYYAELKTAITAFFGKGSPQLAQFGFIPAKPRKPMTSAQKLVAAAKGKETRALRHTASAKQKAAVVFTGQVGVATTVASGVASGITAGAVPAVTGTAQASPVAASSGSGPQPATK